MSDLRTRDAGGAAARPVPLPGRAPVPAPLPEALRAALPTDVQVAPAISRPVGPPVARPVLPPAVPPDEVPVAPPVEAPDGPRAERPGHRLGARLLRLRRHVADPFSRNAYPLILNTALTGVLGLAFWWLAPRYYSDADVGRGSALISVMTMLSGAVAINLSGTLSRFIPRAGRRTGRLVGGVYLLSAVVVAVLSAGFLLTAGRWGPTFDLLRDPVIALSFVPVVVAAAIFTLQDSVLTALRSSFWVPVENTAFGILKIVLLVLMAASFPGPGLYLSWVVAMALLVPPINALIFGRLLPRHRRLTEDHVIPPTRAQVGGFFAADYLGALFVFAAVYLVPVLVAADLPPDAFAHFYLVWTLVGILNLVGNNLATSLTVEGVYDAARLAANCRSALRRATTLLVLAVVVVGLVAERALGALGPGYLAALPALLVLACAALPRAIVEIWIGVLRAQGRTRQVARVQVATGVVVVGSVLTWLQADPHMAGWGTGRITGVAVAVLASYSVVAVALLPGLRRFLAAPNGPSEGTRPGGPVPADGPGRPDQADGPDGPDRPGGRRRVRVGRSRRPSPAVLAVAVLTLAAVLGYLWSLRAVDLAGLTGLGLVSVLPVTALLSLGGLVLAFAIALSLRRAPSWLLGAQVLATVCCLHAPAALVEPLPRFPTAWVHVGFIEYIGRTGTVLPDLDARFNWPGFFALVAFVTGKHEWPGLVGLMTWTPLVSNLLYLLPFGLLLRNLRATRSARWLAAWLFGVLNWVGQDYFSPQGFSYLFFLVFVAILVTWFRRPGPDPLPNPDPDLPRMLVPGELPGRTASPGLRVSLLLLLVAVFVMVTFTHQITPFFMLATLTGLVLLRRCTATGLPWVLGVILMAYVSYLASVYWAGHYSSLMSGLGNLIANLLAGTADRASGGSPEHHAVLLVRLAITAAVFGLALVGWRRRRRRGLDDRVALVLLLAPLPAVLESYGGEMVLRVYLFMLPGACVLAAYTFFPDGFPAGAAARRSWRPHLAAGACGLVLVGGFLFARYGNEGYEITRPAELAAAEYIYAHHGSTVLFLAENDRPGGNPFIPLGYQDVEQLRWVNMLAPIDPRKVDPVVAALRKLGPGSYLMTTRSQERYVGSVEDYPADWGDAFRAQMREVPQVRVVFQNAEAVVYTLRSYEQTAGPVLQHGLAPGTRVEPSPWSAVGLFFLVPLVVVLLTREVLRTRTGPGGHRWLRPLAVMAVPMLVVFGSVLVERLVYLTVVAPPGSAETACDNKSMEVGRGTTTDLLRLQRPSGWCLLHSPFISVWTKDKGLVGSTNG